MKHLGWVVAIGIAWSVTGVAVDGSITPVLSPAGKKRLQENAEIIDNNIKDTKRNVEISDRNVKTLRAELLELETLEKEHLDLKQKHTEYLANASKEVEKNEKAIRDIEKWEKANEKADDPNKKQKLETVRAEKSDREKWRSDAKTKTERVSQLLQSALKNIREIQARKGPLKGQLQSWVDRHKDYEKQLNDLSKKRAGLDKMMKN